MRSIPLCLWLSLPDRITDEAAAKSCLCIVETFYKLGYTKALTSLLNRSLWTLGRCGILWRMIRFCDSPRRKVSLTIVDQQEKPRRPASKAKGNPVHGSPQCEPLSGDFTGLIWCCTKWQWESVIGLGLSLHKCGLISHSAAGWSNSSI